jgi:putative cell wall-binding protein
MARGVVVRHRAVRLLIATGLVLGAMPAQPTSVEATAAIIQRLAGADRYATAAAISAETFSPGVAIAFVATGETFPDSLAAGPAAGRLKSPILLTPRAELAAATRTELARLAPQQIVVLGGTAAISPSVEGGLANYTAGSVTRLAGADRFATAARISAAYFAPGVPVAYVATGRSFPDALSAGAAAARLGGPVLLVDRASIPSVVRAELRRLAPKRIVVVGGSTVVSDAVTTALRAYTGGGVSRQWGADRYATAAAVSAAAFPRDGGSTVHLANGTGFADAVAGVPAAAVTGGSMLLTARDHLPASTATELRRLDPRRVRILGGEAAIRASVSGQIRTATAFARVGPHEFRVDGMRLVEVPEEMLAYNSTTVVPVYGTRNAEGVFIYQAADGRWYDHPVGQAQYVVNMLRNYRIDPDPLYLDLALVNADRLLDRAVSYSGAIFFSYPFDWGLHGRGMMEAPWYSGMAQGIALSGFVRLYEITGDARWLDAAHKTFASFLVARQPGKPWVATVENGLLWLEEYPWQPLDHTFNGHNFAIWGLYDYWRLTGSRDAAEMTTGAMTTSARVAAAVRTPGGISHYCIAQSCLDRKVRNPAYHLTHIGQFIQLFRYTRHEPFARLADTFTADNPNYRSGGTVIFRAGTHVGYAFDSSGNGSSAKSLTLDGSSNASYSSRTVPYGWIAPGNGTWFAMADGYFAGLWVRESPNAYARGFVDRLEYFWNRSVAVPSGTRTGYRFDANGTVTAQKQAPTPATTWTYAVSAKINGRSSVYLSSGPLAGYWIGVSGMTASTLSITSDAMRSAEAGSTQPSGSPRTTPMNVAPPDDSLIPAPMPGQQELVPADGPPDDGANLSAPREPR